MSEYQNHIITKNGQRIFPKTIASIVEDTPRNQSVEQTLTDLLARNDVYIAVIDATQDPIISCSVQEYANISNAINNNTTVVAKIVYGTNLFIFIPLSLFRDDIDGHSAVFSILLSGTNAIFTIYQNDSEVGFEIVNSTPIWGNIEGNIEDQTDLTNALNSKQDALTAGTGITIDTNNVISNDVSPLVPAQASIDNQLADKDFVNSSIATSTATFRGTYNVVTDLHLSTSATHQQVATALGNTISVADNNDYCFVEIPTDDLTPTETLQVDRYKYNGSSWSFEYTLNNSGYTAAQWKAINSGITSGKVTQYDDYATSKQDTLIAGTNITIDADGKTISSDIPQATSSVYGKVLLGAAGGAATYESVGDGKPICYPTTASEVRQTSMVVKSSVSDNGKMLTENGFVYNTSGNPTVSDNKVICDLGVGFMEKVLENLTFNTEYHIKSYGQNSSGISYGSELVQRTSYSPIPSTYQLVEYLESSGTQYIDTLVKINNSLKWEYDYMFLGYGQDQNGGSLNNSERFVIANLTHLYIGMGNGTETTINVLNDRHKFTLDPINNRYGVDDTFNSFTSSLTTINYNVYLFARNTQGTISNWSRGRCYNSKFYISDVLIRNLYPVYRIADNKPGMYDIVNNVFYTNQGTGEFTVGPDKEWDE